MNGTRGNCEMQVRIVKEGKFGMMMPVKIINEGELVLLMSPEISTRVAEYIQGRLME